MSFGDVISASVLSLIKDPRAVAAASLGRVHILNVDAIREAVGEKWERHADLVEDFVLRAFRRSARDDDFIVRVNDADFLLIQPDREPMAALTRASQLMRETLSFFLGSVKSENIHISIVDAIASDGLQARRVAEKDLEAAASRPRDLSLSLDGSPPWEAFGVASTPREVLIIKRPDGSDLRALLYVEPVWRVDRAAVVSFVLRTVSFQDTDDGAAPVEEDDLAPRTHAVLAGRRLAFAQARLEEASDQPIGALHVPVSYAALTQSGARLSVLADLKRHQAAGHASRTIVELTNVPPAAPSSGLAEIVAQLRPFARAVMLRTRLAAIPPAWRHCGVAGFVLELNPSEPERQSLQKIDSFAKLTAEMRCASGLDHVSSRSVALAAWAAGINHLAGDYLAEKCGDTLAPHRFSFADLYSAP